MDKIEKLLRKISRKDREKLLVLIQLLLSKQKNALDIKKIKNSDLCRVRSGRFRIIFHYEASEVVIDSIKMRNEKTYK